MDRNPKSKGRKLYKKPLIKEVELKPEEAVLTGCKAATGAPGPALPTGDCMRQYRNALQKFRLVTSRTAL